MKILLQKQQEMKRENVELLGKLNKLKLDYENANEQIKIKDEKIQQMSKEIQNLVTFHFYYRIPEVCSFCTTSYVL